jgi:hypothetical protein
MGLRAISRYDWIIASRGGNPRMYARPHASDVVGAFEASAYKRSTSDGALKIITRYIDGNEKFKIGDQTISVDAARITEENIYHYYNLLTENQDWSQFEIEVR